MSGLTQKLLCLCFSANLALLCIEGASNTVICVGADGHVRVEWAQDGACVGLSEHDGAMQARFEVHATNTEHTGHCGACWDIPFQNAVFAHATGQGVGKQPDAAPRAQAAPQLPETLVPPSLPAARNARLPINAQRAHSPTRTSVLRI